MTTLTDRYVHAVTHQLSADQRADIAAELRATIEDTVAGRATGVSESDAERTAILALGNPARLADQYRGEARSLIGPRLYDSWVRVLRALLPIVPTIVAAVVLALEIFDDATVLEALGSALTAGLFSALQVAFWVTLGFAITERTGGGDVVLDSLGVGQDWDPDDLPAPVLRQESWGEGIFGIVFHLILIALVTVPGNPSVPIDGRSVGLFTDLALSLRWVVAAGLVISLLASIPVLVRGRWSWPSAIGNAVGSVTFAGPLIWLLATERLFDLAVNDWMGQWGRQSARLVLVVIVLISVWEVVDGFRNAAKARR